MGRAQNERVQPRVKEKKKGDGSGRFRRGGLQ